MYYNNGMKRRGRPRTGRKPNTSIRVDPRGTTTKPVFAAVTSKKTLGVWLEEAIQEKIQREQKGESHEKS